MLSGNRLLFPRRCGFTPHRLATAKGGGVVTGLVPLPRTHLLSSTNDGSCFIPVGSKESQQKLYAYDGIQSSLKMLLPPPSLRYWLEYYINIISDLSFQAYHHRYGCSYIHLTYLILFDCCVSMFFLLAPCLFAVLLNAFSVAISVTDDTPVTDFHQALAERFLVTSKRSLCWPLCMCDPKYRTFAVHAFKLLLLRPVVVVLRLWRLLTECQSCRNLNHLCNRVCRSNTVHVTVR